MQNIIVRAETPDDIRAIDVVNLSAFEGEAEAKLVSALREADCYMPEMSLVAEFNGRIVGHAMLSEVLYKHAGGSTPLLALAPMSVVPSQSHRGIGAALLDAALERARKTGYPAIVEIGQAGYYERLGFRPGADWEIRCNLPVPQHAITVMELKEGGLPKGGEIIYPVCFTELY
jgi:putative acetyltransferase